jgi:hypothetical protein
MVKSHLARLAAIRGRTFVVVLAITPLAALGGASPALATEHHPKGEFAPFAQCPLSNAEVGSCIFAETKGGEFTVGKRTVPIVNTVILQGGVITRENIETEEVTTEFVAAENGETLSKTPQPVPGGLLDIVAPESLPKWLQEIFNNFINEGFTGVTATNELAAPASSVVVNTNNLLDRKGTALSLPLKIKLSNVFLGSECYVGSNSAPIVINFTTGKSGSLEGSPGTLKLNETFTLATISGGRLVNGTFAAPGAKGCGGFLSFLIDPALNSALGLPAETGNKAVLEGALSSANAKAVKASE